MPDVDDGNVNVVFEKWLYGTLHLIGVADAEIAANRVARSRRVRSDIAFK